MGGSVGGRLVLVPGLGLDVGAWVPTLRALTLRLPGGVRSEVVALPGYGVRGHGGDLSPDALARRLLSSLGDGPVVLGGHSASCQIVARAAALDPTAARGLVLIGPTTDPRAASWHRLAGRWLATARHEPPWQVPHLVRQYSRTGLPTMRRAMGRARRDDIQQSLRAASCPVLVVRGPHDRIAPEDWARRLVTRSVGGEVVTLGAGGHMVPLTHPEECAAAVAGFWARLP